MYLIGTDEAGYGPNLGPLVVSATLWRVPDGAGDVDLYETLADYVSRERVAAADPRLPIADSKQLYSSGDSWEQLELGLLSALHVLRKPCSNWPEVWHSLAEPCLSQVAAQPWHDKYELTTPQAADLMAIQERAACLAAGLALKKVELLAVASRAVFPGEFNSQCAELGNKSTVLSHTTLALVRDLIREFEIDEPLLVHCDKHGGRNFYAGLIQHFFPDEFVMVKNEGRERSVYRCGPPNKPYEFRFVAKGEGFMPAALASMACKYLRELSMHAFNHYWQQHVPDLKPTAGYPEDARRFQKAIAVKQRELGIADDVLWRKK